jgi:phosphoglycolate phosphatase (TIGR01487 family)
MTRAPRASSTRGASPGWFPEATGIRGVISDIDGTLTGRDRVLDAGAAQMLREIETSGTPVVLATGNVLPIALAIHRSIGLHGPIVAENGGMVYDQPGGKERVLRLADRRPAWAAFQRARRAGLPLRRLFTDRWRETEVAIEPTVPVPAIERAIRGLGIRAEGTGFAIHLMEQGAGKHQALTLALRRLGLSWSSCLVAGDGENDVQMLRAAGWGVSFANGSPRARRAARYVARAAYAEGFREALMERRSLDGGSER